MNHRVTNEDTRTLAALFVRNQGRSSVWKAGNDVTNVRVLRKARATRFLSDVNAWQAVSLFLAQFKIEIKMSVNNSLTVFHID